MIVLFDSINLAIDFNIPLRLDEFSPIARFAITNNNEYTQTISPEDYIILEKILREEGRIYDEPIDDEEDLDSIGEILNIVYSEEAIYIDVNFSGLEYLFQELWIDAEAMVFCKT